MSHTVFKLFGLVLLLPLVGCNFNKFGVIEPAIEPFDVNCTFNQLPIGSVISWDAIAQGVVVSSDSTGNFYREIILQQPGSDLNIALQVNVYDMFAVWRLGMVVGVKFRDLAIEMVDGRLLAGIWGEDGHIVAIPSFAAGLERMHFQGYYGAPTVLERTIDGISDADVGKLITLRNIYFINQGTTFSGSQQLAQMGSEATISLYTSPYASFATSIVPIGIVDMTAFVELKPSGTPQLKICSI